MEDKVTPLRYRKVNQDQVVNINSKVYSMAHVEPKRKRRARGFTITSRGACPRQFPCERPRPSVLALEYHE